jgi:hypothetical protein
MATLPSVLPIGKVARAKGECWLCAQRGISKPNKGKGRCRTAHCDSCRRWLKGSARCTHGQGPSVMEAHDAMIAPSVTQVVRGASGTARAPFVVEQVEGEALYLPHWVKHSTEQTLGRPMVCSDGKRRKVVVSFAMWVNENLGGAALRFARTTDVNSKEGQVLAGGGRNAKAGPPSAEALCRLQRVVDGQGTCERITDTPQHVWKLGARCSLAQLGLSEDDLNRVVKAVTTEEWQSGGTLDAGLDDMEIQAMARRVARRLVGDPYLTQNANATHGVSAVLAIDGGDTHQALNTDPAFAVRVVGDRGRALGDTATFRAC